MAESLFAPLDTARRDAIVPLGTHTRMCAIPCTRHEPTTQSTKETTQHGANRLAAAGLGALTCGSGGPRRHTSLPRNSGFRELGAKRAAL